jgi:hypothetical protein
MNACRTPDPGRSAGSPRLAVLTVGRAAPLLAAMAISPAIAEGFGNAGAAPASVASEAYVPDADGKALETIDVNSYDQRPQKAIARKTFDAWAASWWQWVLGIPADRNPLNDTTGAFCTQGQAGDVWFLAAGANVGGKLSCTIPANKYLFFPIVTSVWVVTEDWETFPMADAAVDQWLDHMTAVSATLDGVSLTRLRSQRVESAKFTVLFPFNNIWAITTKPFACTQVASGYSCPNSVTNGYWVMLKPLPTGNYTLRVQGNVAQSIFHWPNLADQTLKAFKIDTTFNLKVK